MLNYSYTNIAIGNLENGCLRDLYLGNTRVTYRAVEDPYTHDLTKQIEYAADYMPYGKLLRHYEGPQGQEKYLTTHHERDEETQLDYRGARYYDSDIGRFLSCDTMQHKFVSWNSYNYVLCNPIMLIDADGKSPTSPPNKVYVYNVWMDKNGVKQSTLSHSYIDKNRTTNVREYRYYNGNGDMVSNKRENIEPITPTYMDTKQVGAPDATRHDSWEGGADATNSGTSTKKEVEIVKQIIYSTVQTVLEGVQSGASKVNSLPLFILPPESYGPPSEILKPQPQVQ